MSELDSGVQKKLIVDQNRVKDNFKPQYITDSAINESSAKEIYFRWLSRLVTLCAILSLGLFLSSSLVIFRLVPEIVVEPLLISRDMNSSETLVRYEPITPKMQSIRKLTEMFIKQYVIMYNTVINDAREMRARWSPSGIVSYLSAPDVYRDFMLLKKDIVNQISSADYSEEVRIDSIGKVTESSPAWKVEFTVYRLSKGVRSDGTLELKKIHYSASVTPKYIPERRALFYRLLNPLGFTVVKYNQQEISEE